MGSYIQALLGVQSGPIAAPTGALRTDVDAQSAHVTLLLKQLSNGNEEAAARLIPLVYDELHRVAQCHLQAERPDHTLLNESRPRARRQRHPE